MNTLRPWPWSLISESAWWQNVGMVGQKGRESVKKDPPMEHSSLKCVWWVRLDETVIKWADWIISPRSTHAVFYSTEWPFRTFYDVSYVKRDVFYVFLRCTSCMLSLTTCHTQVTEWDWVISRRHTGNSAAPLVLFYSSFHHYIITKNQGVLGGAKNLCIEPMHWMADHLNEWNDATISV